MHFDIQSVGLKCRVFLSPFVVVYGGGDRGYFRVQVLPR